MDLVTQPLEMGLAYAGNVAVWTMTQLALVLGPPLLLAALMQPIALHSERAAQRLAGARPHWIVVGWIATALHELGHALFALLFGHRVTQVKWFDFRAADGSHGRVDHRYDPGSFYQRAGRFFIGAGPVIVGVVLLALAARLLLGPHGSEAPVATADGLAPLDLTRRSVLGQLGASLRDVGRLAASLRLGRWESWLFLYVAYVAGSVMRLSASDLRSVGAGGWTVASLLLLVNALTLWAGAIGTSLALAAARGLALCNAALLAAVALQALVALAAVAVAHALAALRSRSAAAATA